MRWEIAVVGGGVIGASIAFELGDSARVSVLVLDEPSTGLAASQAAVGLLVAGGVEARAGFWWTLRQRAADLWPEWIARLESSCAVRNDYRRGSVWHLASDEEESTKWRDEVALRRGGVWRDVATLRAEFGLELGGVLGGVCFREDAVVDPQGLLTSMRLATRAVGVSWEAARVERVETQKRGVRLVLSNGRVVEAERVVIAAGCGSVALAASLGLRLPVRPVQGERLTCRLFPRVAWSPMGFSMRQAAVVVRNGSLMVGGGKVRMGPPCHLTERGVERLLHEAVSLLPSLAGTDVLEARAGLRPCSQLRHPLLGFVDEDKRVLVATGHHRSGILWAPLTALLVREALLGDTPSVPLDAFAW